MPARKLVSGIAVVLAAVLFLASKATAQEVWSVGKGELKLNMSEAKFIKLDRPASAVFLSNPNVAEIDLQSARYLYIVGKAIGQTNLFVLGENDEEILSTTISVGIDADRIASAAQNAVSGGWVSVKTLDGAVFLSGEVPTDVDAATAEDVVAALLGDGAIIVNRLELQTVAQVNLQVRIAEVSRSISEDLGFSLTAGTAGGARVVSQEGGFELRLGNDTNNINLVLDALAKDGLVTILSEPNLTARSGEAATFLAGGRIPYRVVDDDGKVSIEFEPIGVELEFTPTVFEANQIQLEINTRVRAVDPANSTLEEAPALTERSATTTVELGSGQSFAIAGMFQTDTVQSMSGLPGLSKLPILGALFRSSKFKRGETELVIIVTPYLVAPTSGSELRTPVDDIDTVDSGLEQAVTGKFTKVIRPGEKGKSRVRRGGFILQ
jgi:pilus assembly protein CpaC